MGWHKDKWDVFPEYLSTIQLKKLKYIYRENVPMTVQYFHWLGHRTKGFPRTQAVLIHFPCFMAPDPFKPSHEDIRQQERDTDLQNPQEFLGRV